MSQAYLPAEWAPQQAVMLTWPREDGDFAHHFDQVEINFLEIARQISRFEPVWINYCGEPESLRRQLSSSGARLDHIKIHKVASDDVWARDHGPITVVNAQQQLIHLDFCFNGWGGKFDASRDNEISTSLNAIGALPGQIESLDFVLEGGAIEVDGRGTLLTTERCLLAKTRNPAMNREDIEGFLKSRLGLERIHWLKHGDLLGDDTDGHIDTIARFCDEHTIAYQACEDVDDAHYADLQALEQELRALRQSDGRPYRLIPLPLPSAIVDEDGKRLPAGYANFLILNGALLVPVYGVAQDEAALDLLRPLFPAREVIGVNCRPLIQQYGSLHCVTMQIPATAA